MTESTAPTPTPPERAFLDANVMRGQMTNDILLSMAAEDVFEPRWSQGVIDEMRRNRPEGVSEAKIDKRIDAMNKYFPRAMTDGHEGLESRMQADAKDKHVLAAAVHSKSDVLVTDNIKDFHPPSTGPDAMRVEKLSQFLNRKLEERPDRVQAALQGMVSRYQRDPRTMSALIDKMATQPELRSFAQKLNTVVPEGQRGTAEVLTANQRGSAQHAALKGMTNATGAVQSTPKLDSTKPAQTPNSPNRGQGTEL